MDDFFEEMDLVYDMDRMDDEEDTPDRDDESLAVPADSAGDALIACIRQKGSVSLSWMSTHSGLDVSELISRLKGHGIFQDPDHMQESDTYDPKDGWVLAASYLTGNLRQKRQRAKVWNERFPGLFQENLDAIDRRLPSRIPIDQIHLSLGATWIPEEMYGEFIAELLDSWTVREVIYEPVLGVWKTEYQASDLSYVRNNLTYGTLEISALKIIEQTMNARTVKIYDRKYVRDDEGKLAERSILNREKTQQAQDRQRQICEAFADWCMSDVHRMEELETCYNEEFSAFSTVEFDGSFLDFPGLNPDIHLYDHQKNAVARILLSGKNTLLAHEVGTGKTYELICAAHEMKRLNIANRILITVPNQVFQDFISAHELLYPDDDILTIRSSQMTPAKRQKTLEMIRDSEFTVCYMAHSTFDRVKMSHAYWVKQKQKEIQNLKNDVLSLSGSLKYKLTNRIKALSESLIRFEEKNDGKDEGLCYDDLNFDALFVDEAHKYKNIPLQCRADNVVGLNANGAVKCKEMVEKARSTEHLVFATGTPLTNSIADLFVLQSYLQPDELADLQVGSFDQWINTFAQRETNFEVDVDSSHLRPMTRFSTFHNLPELMALFSTVCDFHYADAQEDLLPEFNGYSDVTVEKTRSQAEYIADLVERTENVRNRKVSRKTDNLLKITNDGRMCAMDLRLLDEELPEAEIPFCKISQCADKVTEMAREFPDSAQLVFSDIGTPKKTFNVYDELKKQLLERGFQESEIAFVHDAETEIARKKLFAAVNQGKVRVMIGSTEKLGTGVNVQERLVAMHHLSVPWRPADMVQREGRIIRQGNTSKEVRIFRYITEGTFDSYSWQLLENKQRFISAFLAGSAKERTMEDIADTVLSYAELKAIAIGNPLIKKRVETANALERTKTRYRQRQNQLQNLQIEIKSIPDKIFEQKTSVQRMQADDALYKKMNRVISRDEREKIGNEIITGIYDARYIMGVQFYNIMEYKGFQVLVRPSDYWYSTSDPKGEKPIYLKGRSIQQLYPLKVKTDSAIGLTMSLDYLLSHLPDQITQAQNRIERLGSDLENAKRELAKGNSFTPLISQLEEKLSRIDEKIEEAERLEEERKQAMKKAEQLF